MAKLASLLLGVWFASQLEQLVPCSSLLQFSIGKWTAIDPKCIPSKFLAVSLL
jgi:hypothetical protein